MLGRDEGMDGPQGLSPLRPCQSIFRAVGEGRAPDATTTAGKAFRPFHGQKNGVSGHGGGQS